MQVLLYSRFQVTTWLQFSCTTSTSYSHLGKRSFNWHSSGTELEASFSDCVFSRRTLVVSNHFPMKFTTFTASLCTEISLVAHTELFAKTARRPHWVFRRSRAVGTVWRVAVLSAQAALAPSVVVVVWMQEAVDHLTNRWVFAVKRIGVHLERVVCYFRSDTTRTAVGVVMTKQRTRRCLYSGTNDATTRRMGITHTANEGQCRTFWNARKFDALSSPVW